MLSIRTVLCSVDFSTATARQVDLAIEICQAFGARLILHHNHIELSVGSGVGVRVTNHRASSSGSCETNCTIRSG